MCSLGVNHQRNVRRDVHRNHFSPEECHRPIIQNKPQDQKQGNEAQGHKKGQSLQRKLRKEDNGAYGEKDDWFAYLSSEVCRYY